MLPDFGHDHDNRRLVSLLFMQDLFASQPVLGVPEIVRQQGDLFYLYDFNEALPAVWPVDLRSIDAIRSLQQKHMTSPLRCLSVYAHHVTRMDNMTSHEWGAVNLPDLRASFALRRVSYAGPVTLVHMRSVKPFHYLAGLASGPH